MEQKIAVTISVQGRESTVGEALTYELRDEEKSARARKVAGIFIAIAVGSLFIPIVHFVAPWLSLIVAAISYGKVRNQTALLRGASGPCPACGEAIAVPEQTLEWPVEWNCVACRKRTQFVPVRSQEST